MHFHKQILVYFDSILLKIVPTGLTDNASTLVQGIAWSRTGGKPLNGVMLTKFHNHHKAPREHSYLNMMTSSNGNISALLALCAGNSPDTVEFPSQRPVTRSFNVFFDLRLNEQLNKQWRGWWFETTSRSSWGSCNEGKNVVRFNKFPWMKFLLLTF